MYCSIKIYRTVLLLCVVCVICYNYWTLYFDLRNLFRGRDSQTNVSWQIINKKVNGYLGANFLTTIQNEVKPSYLILVYKYGPFLERRHIRRFTDQKFSPWENCSVKSCKLSYSEDDLNVADAVIFHLHLTRSVLEIPARVNYNQKWVFLTDESPFNTFLYRKQDISDYNGLFNWSMTYRSDSDIPVPYGRTISLSDPDEDYHLQMPNKTKLLAIMGSNCGGNNNRWSYVTKLKELLGGEFDIFGRCQNGNVTACPGHFARDCSFLQSYKFYLAFENSNCKEYMTEKLFWNAYAKFAVPVIMGAPKEDCESLLPPSSYLHVLDFASPVALADYLKYLHRNPDKYQKYHEWRRNYRISNEHGYFGSASFHYCRICEALHYNDGRHSVYEDLSLFWNKDIDCDN